LDSDLDAGNPHQHCGLKKLCETAVPVFDDRAGVEVTLSTGHVAVAVVGMWAVWRLLLQASDQD